MNNSHFRYYQKEPAIVTRIIDGDNVTVSNIGYINISGDLCIIKGDCSDQSTNCNNPADGAFIMANSTSYVSYIDGEGDLCLVGRLYQNSNP